jgi:hypothetical protein
MVLISIRYAEFSLTIVFLQRDSELYVIMLENPNRRQIVLIICYKIHETLMCNPETWFKAW